MANPANMEKNMQRRFPIAHVLGFLLSLALTFGAAWVALETDMSLGTTLGVIGTLAVIQAALQLFMFMHVTEGNDKKAQLINIIYGVFVAVVIVAGTIWVMSFGLHTH